MKTLNPKTSIGILFTCLTFCFESYASSSNIEIEAYSNTKKVEEYKQEFIEYPLTQSPIDQNGNLNVTNIDGRYHHKLFEGNEDDSILLAYRRLTATLKESKFNPMFNCKNEECGGDLVAKLFEGSPVKRRYSRVQYSGPVYNDFYYLVGRKTVEEVSIHLVFFIYKYSGNRLYIAQDLVYSEDKEILPLSVTTKFDDLARTGKTVIEGLLFENDSTELTSTSKATLDSIAEYLKLNSTKKFYIVGHTDSNGPLDYNLKLSERRANAVKQALLSTYKIEPSRLSAYGVGQLSPADSNSSHKGRIRNRRVELVLSKQ